MIRTSYLLETVAKINGKRYNATKKVNGCNDILTKWLVRASLGSVAHTIFAEYD